MSCILYLIFTKYKCYLHNLNTILPSRSLSIVASSSSKCLSLISSFFICVSTSSATRDLIFLSSTPARCFAFTAAAARAAAAADCSFASTVVGASVFSVKFQNKLIKGMIIVKFNLRRFELETLK